MFFENIISAEVAHFWKIPCHKNFQDPVLSECSVASISENGTEFMLLLLMIGN
jgi:hypothetical protein